jgi:hypothetical protein
MAEVSDASGNWRKPYKELYHLPRLAFSWEYLRRNERFRQTAAGEFARWQKVSVQRGLTIYRGGEAISGNDCLFADLLEAGAGLATVFWNPGSHPSVLRAVASRWRGENSRFSLENCPLPTTLLLGSDGTQHVLIRDRLRSLQMEVRGDSLLQPVSLMVDTGVASIIGDRQDRALQLLRAYRVSAALPQEYFPPDPHAQRLAFVLQALDGWLAGARHRDIAEALYGPDRVARDWTDPREHLRDQVRHAIVRGRALMDHGYRAFLA